MYLYNFFKLSLMTAIVGLSAPMSAFGQSQGEYSKIENRDCRVWNSNPFPNETVYWTGKCVNGMAEGKGIIAYGNIKDGRPQVSISDVTLENAKPVGLGEYYSRAGRITKHSYEGGKRASSENYNITAETPSTKEDIFASRFRHGLVREVGMSDLKALAAYGGFEIIRERVVNNRPIIWVKSDNGFDFSLSGRACRSSNASGCRGIYLGAAFQNAESLTYSQVNKINKQYAIITTIRDVQEPSKFNISLYIILDAGQKPENVRLIMTNFEAVVRNVITEFKVTQN